MQPKLKVRIGNSKRERQRVLYNKVARQHCVWVIWHSFRFAHKNVNTFRVVFFLIRSTLPASFYDKQNACKSRILQTINALRQAAACHPWGGSRLPLTLSLLCRTIYATCCAVCVAETNPTNAQMRMCTHSMLIFPFSNSKSAFYAQIKQKTLGKWQSKKEVRHREKKRKQEAAARSRIC